MTDSSWYILYNLSIELSLINTLTNNNENNFLNFLSEMSRSQIYEYCLMVHETM
jgi:hypothetical protein